MWRKQQNFWTWHNDSWKFQLECIALPKITQILSRDSHRAREWYSRLSNINDDNDNDDNDNDDNDDEDGNANHWHISSHEYVREDEHKKRAMKKMAW